MNRRCKVGCCPSGPPDAITDEAGVGVGHTTVTRGTSIRAGVTLVMKKRQPLATD